MKLMTLLGSLMMLAAMVVLLWVVWGNMDGNPKSGERVAQSQCGECHDFSPEHKHLKGPSLWGVAGRQAGTAEGFPFSPQFREFVQKHPFSWTHDNLDAYITNPEGFLPGTEMANQEPQRVTIEHKGVIMTRAKHGSFFTGLPDLERRKDLVAYLETLR